MKTALRHCGDLDHESSTLVCQPSDPKNAATVHSQHFVDNLEPPSIKLHCPW